MLNIFVERREHTHVLPPSDDKINTKVGELSLAITEPPEHIYIN